ncbi:phosphoribosylglycinamide formyltransferase [Consotaella salsifontis]|uniref:Phosphoribosylglycinamide formyltransferase n=1 Tax=Consotaella salsifontis TaxID=1365950 RepID=A0A1T4P4B4_9HYPH|nr:phosphoribosylglycinamide formyltransferase [Consotaella salsifontis]SJZ85768.1 phosphoribosylglycinamide formyltransferase-1 [Consotaella salsifontis]
MSQTANSRERKRVAVLISGRGSNMNAIIAAAMDPAYPGQVVAVIANRPEAPGLEVAARHGIAAIAVDQRRFSDRPSHEAAVAAELDRFSPDVVCLAGYMRLLTEPFVQRYRGRLINIHPSLLPLFPGLDTHKRVLAAGMRVHGCTVHFVTERMDEGPIIAQAAIAIRGEDTEETLAARLLHAEHRLYPHALKLVLDGDARLSGGHAIFRPIPPADAEDDTSSAAPRILVSPDPRRD